MTSMKTFLPSTVNIPKLSYKDQVFMELEIEGFLQYTMSEAVLSEPSVAKKGRLKMTCTKTFFALHGEYPKAFVTGPGIYGVGNAGISTVYDVRSSPFGSIG